MLLALGKALGQQEAWRDDFIGQMLSHDVSRENYQTWERTEKFDARKMKQFVYIPQMLYA